MSTSKHTFDQVKSILGKLDRSIDDARAKRLDGDQPSQAAPVPVASGAGSGAVPAAPAAPRAPFAPARPLRATPNYRGQGAALNGRSDHQGH